MSHTEREYITLCKKQIEEKLRLENGGALKQRDLEYLADVIEEKSGIKLSLSTLKRLWKDDYEQTPHPSTLQALVSVLDIKDWQEFKLKQPPAHSNGTSIVSPPPSATPKAKKKLSKWVLLPLAAACLALVWWAITFNTHPPQRPVVTGTVTFDANKTVTQGVPNTVIFNYDLKNVKADSFFIQQSWNAKEKMRIDPTKNYASRIYYYPGFHRAKLIANDSIIVRKRIHITTDGWFPLVKYSNTDMVPVYLQKTNNVANGVYRITADNLTASNVNTSRDFELNCLNVREFDNTSSDNFVLDTRIKCDSTRNFACPGIQLTVMCEEHIFWVQLLPKGCARNIAVKMGEVYTDGRQSNLSALGCNVYQWQNLRLQVVNKQATVFLNDQPVYTSTFKEDFGKIVGLAYQFMGTGSIDYCRLGKTGSNWVYKEEFDK